MKYDELPDRDDDKMKDPKAPDRSKGPSILDPGYNKAHLTIPDARRALRKRVSGIVRVD